MAAPLVQIQPSVAPAEPARKPSWLKVKAPGGPNYLALKHMMRDLKLHTVCEEAHCPNIGECWEHKAATFMILGDVCTRNCAYCAVAHGTPLPLDAGEPRRLGDAACVNRGCVLHKVGATEGDGATTGACCALCGAHALTTARPSSARASRFDMSLTVTAGAVRGFPRVRSLRPSALPAPAPPPRGRRARRPRARPRRARSPAHACRGSGRKG